MLTALVLAVPILVAANPIDPTWLPGWYDDADMDLLVIQSMSPESMITLAVWAFVWVSTAGPRVSETVQEQDAPSSREPVPRGPPQVTTLRARSSFRPFAASAHSAPPPRFVPPSFVWRRSTPGVTRRSSLLDSAIPVPDPVFRLKSSMTSCCRFDQLEAIFDGMLPIAGTGRRDADPTPWPAPGA